ncbi:MAG: protein kinase [Cellvibrio sp.]
MTQSPLSQTTELTHIGHYTIISRIGRGGMGLVYLARDTRLDRQVAIKCLRAELFEPHYRERFKREALLLAKLNHSHIVQIYDYQETDDQLALVMEYVEGQNLQQHLRENIVSLAQRMQWLAQIAQGLAVAHDAGIIHRDLKAENILINKHKLAKITDLGIAKSQDFNATLTDHVTGSYASMSPEQAMGEELDNRSDLFSFGILAYQLLCGVHPFGDTQNKLQLMQRIISHPPIPPTKTNPGLPAEVIELLGQLLSKNPDNRPANTHWVAAQCEKLYQLICLANHVDIDTTQILNHSHSSNSGIRNLQHSREHPTFESGIGKKKTSIIQEVKDYVRTNSITVVFIGIALLMIAGAFAWQLQPKPPKYLAVLPPQLTTTEMPGSQQELVKGAVYDAIQQSILQLNNYYLIPHTEIADINAENNRQGLEILREATSADELITTTIECGMEDCKITLTRLIPDKMQENRLRVRDTKTVDVLTDNYLSVATIIQGNIGEFYSATINNQQEKINSADYAKFLEANHMLRTLGADKKSLDVMDGFTTEAQSEPAIQTLYKDISLDLFYETKNPVFLDRLKKYLVSNNTRAGKITYLHNQYYLHIAKSEFDDAEKIAEQLESINPSSSFINELYAYLMMSKGSYDAAANFYTKAIESKKTANNFYNLALAYWYSSKTGLAKENLEKSLALSPQFYKSNNLAGVIALSEGEIDKAMASFKKTTLQKPKDVFNINNLGLCYLLQKQYASASELFKRASQLSGTDTTYKLNEADAENLAGNIEYSTAIYTEIINSTGANENLDNEKLRHISQAYAHLKNFSAALTALQKLEKNDPEYIGTLYSAALVHTLAKNNTSAIFNISRALEKNMHVIWFEFSWFDHLCSDEKFVHLMKNRGKPDRCASPGN